MDIKYPMLIDGGLSNVLESQGCDLNHELWSAEVLQSNPEAIVQAHLAYLKSGAQCLISSSYQATIPGLMAQGYSLSQAEALIVKTIELAKMAVDRFTPNSEGNGRPLIAASIGPFGAYLADDSEYRGNYGVSDQTLEEFHLRRIQLLDKTEADFFACETIPSFQEARVLSEILRHTQKSAWVSFSCKDESHINDGTKITECASLFSTHPNVFAVGVNCTPPKYISGLIRSIKSVLTEKKIVVYPNSGESFNASTKTWLGISEPTSFVQMATEWKKLGADILGGCCRIGPDHIKSLSNSISFTS